MLRVLVWVGAAFLALVVALVLYLWVGDLDRYRPQVEAAASSLLGREVKIAGDFEPKILPAPSLVATAVTLANAEWGAATPMVSVGRLSVGISLWSLVSGPLRIKSLELEDVAILLEESESGEGNWALGKPAPAQTPAPAPARAASAAGPSASWVIPVIVDLASISRVTVLLKRPAQDDMPAALDALDLHTQPDGSIVATIAGSAVGIPFDMNAAIARPSSPGGSAHVDLDGMLGEVALRGGADVTLERVDFDLVVSTLDKVGAAFAVAGLPAADLQLEGSLIAAPGGYELRDTTAKLLSMQARVGGVMSNDVERGIALDVSVNAPNVQELRAGLPMLALTSTAKARIVGDKIDVEPLEVQFGDSDFAGSLSVNLGDAFALALRGESKVVDLTPFQPAEAHGSDGAQTPAAAGDAAKPAAPPAKSAAPAAEPAASAAKQPAHKWLFGEEELPFHTLGTATVDAELAIAELRARDARLQNVVLGLEAKDGTFALKTRFEARGGAADGSVVLATANDGADLSIDLTARDLRLNLASGDVQDESEIPPVGVSASIRSTGNSPRALASVANGRVLFTQGAGRIDNGAVGVVSGDVLAQVFSALNPFAKEEKYTKWDCTIVALNIKDGQAVIDPMLAQAEKLMITGGGKVDLKTEKLDVEFNTKPRSGVGITADMFVTPFVKVSGTLASPGVGMNASGTVLSGGAAVLTGGISLVVQGLADRATGERDQCEKTREKAGQGPPAN